MVGRRNPEIIPSAVFIFASPLVERAAEYNSRLRRIRRAPDLRVSNLSAPAGPSAREEHGTHIFTLDRPPPHHGRAKTTRMDDRPARQPAGLGNRRLRYSEKTGDLACDELEQLATVLRLPIGHFLGDCLLRGMPPPK